MSDSIFKVGDLVKRIAEPEHDYRYMKGGEVYTVTGLPTYCSDSIQVNGFTECWDIEYFELYEPQKVAIGSQPTDDLQSELTEALAHIESLESALEDAVRELISLREGNNTAVIDVDNSEFKPINEMTLEDWELANEERWVFELNNGEKVFVQGIMEEFDSEDFPVELSYVGEGTHAGIVTVDGCFFPDQPANSNSVKCRIK